MKYLKLFENHSQYEDYMASGLTLPNVSHCIQEIEVHYNQFVETKVVCKYNVTSISEPTALRTNYEQNVFKSMEVDGVMLDELVTAYTFDSIGVHTVKCELYDETKLGNGAPTFYNGNLIEATIPSGVTSIGMNVFNSCTSLTSCTFDKNSQLTTIGATAFISCNGLTSIEIPSGVTSIGGNAFASCTSLTSIDIPNSVTSIGTAAFSSCSGLTSVTIGSGVTSIGDDTFHFCSSLTSCTIGSGVTSIGNYAFGYCSSLTSIDIPNSVTSIGGFVFRECRSLTTITSNATTAPTIYSSTFQDLKTNGTLYVPQGSSGYDTWMGTGNYYLGKYGWTKVEQ